MITITLAEKYITFTKNTKKNVYDIDDIRIVEDTKNENIFYLKSVSENVIIPNDITNLEIGNLQDSNNSVYTRSQFLEIVENINFNSPSTGATIEIVEVDFNTTNNTPSPTTIGKKAGQIVEITANNGVAYFEYDGVNWVFKKFYKKFELADVPKNSYTWSLPLFNISFNTSAPYNYFALSGFAEYSPNYSYNTGVSNKALLVSSPQHHIFYSQQNQVIKKISFFFAQADFEFVIFKTNFLGNNAVEIFYKETTNSFFILDTNIKLAEEDYLHFFFKIRNKTVGGRHFGKIHFLLEN